MMRIPVTFYSYFKELAGCESSVEELPPGATVEELHAGLMARFPKLAPMKRSTLIAVGVSYEPRDYVLKEGDEVALFPPVQGG
jgi:molybdopterin converting factor small subunit